MALPLEAAAVAAEVGRRDAGQEAGRDRVGQADRVGVRGALVADRDRVGVASRPGDHLGLAVGLGHDQVGDLDDHGRVAGGVVGRVGVDQAAADGRGVDLGAARRGGRDGVVDADRGARAGGDGAQRAGEVGPGADRRAGALRGRHGALAEAGRPGVGQDHPGGVRGPVVADGQDVRVGDPVAGRHHADPVGLGEGQVGLADDVGRVLRRRPRSGARRSPRRPCW